MSLHFLRSQVSAGFYGPPFWKTTEACLHCPLYFPHLFLTTPWTVPVINICCSPALKTLIAPLIVGLFLGTCFAFCLESLSVTSDPMFPSVLFSGPLCGGNCSWDLCRYLVLHRFCCNYLRALLDLAILGAASGAYFSLYFEFWDNMMLTRYLRN